MANDGEKPGCQRQQVEKCRLVAAMIIVNRNNRIPVGDGKKSAVAAIKYGILGSE